MPVTLLALDLEVRRRNRREDTIQVTGNPGDHAWLQKQLRGWLKGNGWAVGRWGEFEMIARPAGQGKNLAKVRA
jgi:hypothetical protein